MPAATPNAADLALGAGQRYLSGLITAIADQTPVITNFPAYDLKGTFIYALALAALPTATGFVDLNEGGVSTKAQLVMGKVDAKRMYLIYEAAKSSTDLWNQQNPSMSWRDIQIKARLLAELQNLEKTIFLGTANDAKAFFGLKEICAAVTANVYALTDPIILPLTKSALNVGGSTASTATSVYSVCHGIEDCALYYGGPQGIAGFLNFTKEQLIVQADPGDATRKQEYYFSSAEGYTVLSLMGSSEAYATRKYSQFSVRRAFNITADSGKTCTEEVLDKLIAMHPMGHKPTAFYMSIRSQLQLLASRVASGTIQLPPGMGQSQTVRPYLPTEHRGIPIIVTEGAILDTQAIETVV